MSCSDSLDQFFLLLWKSWKSFIRSRGWLIAQVAITLLIWGVLFLNMGTIRGFASHETPFNSTNHDTSFRDLDYKCIDENNKDCNCSSEIIKSLSGFCTMSSENKTMRKSVRLEMMTRNMMDYEYSCGHTTNNSDLIIRSLNKSTLDIQITWPLSIPNYASNQFDNLRTVIRDSKGEFILSSSNRNYYLSGREITALFLRIAKQVGNLSGFNIKTIVPLTFRSEQNTGLWEWIILAYSLAILFLFIQSSREVSQEAISKMKDYLISMGMNRTLYFLHHFFFNYLKTWIPIVGCSVFFGFCCKSIEMGIYLLLIFSLSLAPWISISLIIGSCIKRPGTCTFVSLMVWLTLTSLPMMHGIERTDMYSLVYSLSPHYAIWMSFDAKREADLRGMNIWFYQVEQAVPQGYFLIMIVFDALVYFFLAVFIDWMRSSFENPFSLFRGFKEVSKSLADNHEKPESLKDADLVMEGVHKWYSSGEYAVRGVDMSMHKGQVTALLGHNGAGKSTIFSMISGMTVPTKGRIEVKGNDNRKERQKLIGYCPQYNPIFPNLTVEEHLLFFSSLRGVDSWNEKGERVLNTLGMADKGKIKASILSGGMRRKLCIAIALAGDSPVILLDEPTAGLDPGARRDFERLLLQWKKKHAILLTTHYTDEAEMLADRIFIMAGGKVFCSGSPQFLRKKFDSGFVLSFAVENESDLDRASDEMIKLVKEFAPSAILCKRRGKQFEFKLCSDDSKRFVEMFRKMEMFGSYFGVQSYGISLNKLEQVFLKVGEMTGTIDRTEEVEAALKELIQENDKRVRGSMKTMKQFGNILLKRLNFDKSHVVSLLINLISLFGFVYSLFILSQKFDMLDTSGSRSLLNVSDCYRIGIDWSLHAHKTDIEQISKKNFGECLIIERTSTSVDEWYEMNERSRPPLLGGLSRNGNEWTILIHPRNDMYMSTLAAIAAMINNPSLTTVNLGYRKPDDEVEKLDKNKDMIRNYLVILILGLSYPMMIIRPIGFHIIERVSNFGHQQRLTGLKRNVLIFSSIFYDFLLFLLHCFIFFTAAFIAEPSYVKNSLLELSYLLFIGFLSGELIILISYRFFSSRAKGENLMLMLFTILGVNSIGSPVHPLLLLNPMGAASVWKIGLNYNQNTKTEFYRNPGLGKITGPLFIAIHFIALVFIFILLERRVFSRKNKQTTSNTVSTYQMSDSLVLRVNDIVKWYGSKKNRFYAVKGISFGVRSHECFGVLGVNGAGKTTTFEVLTGNTFPDEGSATVGGVDCSTPTMIGYCPQTDSLIEDLSGRESLIILAALHGYENPRKAADIVITCVGMKEHANRPSKRYSGGQRRKISVAASLLAQNSLIILDEPTAGIDPISRRDIWNVICALRESTNTAIVLTSHSMDEVEALVSNLIIMKEGLIVVEGTTQMIKNQFGEHYNFNLTIENVSHVGIITSRVLSVFPRASLYDSSSLRNIKYRIPRKSTDVFSSIYEKAEVIAEELKAIDFSFTQATLEDAFMLAASSKPDVETAVAAVSSSVRRIRSESAKEETEGTEGKTTGTDGRGTEGTEGGGTEGRETDWIDGGTEGIDGSSSAKAHEA